MSDHPKEAFKIVDAGEWAVAEATGSYAGSAVDLTDGYIHLSAADQLAGTVRKHYAGRENLLLLTVDLTGLGEALIWEPSRGGALFPHFYGPLPVAAVTATKTFSVGADGAMVFA
ncbi:MAG TPA: DUF952 domain-containing protein [Brevundimonas sp.]|jgi:uncharacterized protein (DUF952 family)